MAAAAAADAASSAGRRCKVAVGQMTSVGDQLTNFKTCKQLAEVGTRCTACYISLCASCYFRTLNLIYVKT
jgi:hypothetical protein